MIYTKCVKINQDNEYILKDGDNNTYTFTKFELTKEIEDENIKVINLNYDLEFDWSSAYKKAMLLGTKSILEKTKHTYNKAILLGISPDTTNNGIFDICNSGTYEELCITDCTNILGGNIKANKITFVGTQGLSIDTKQTSIVHVECNKAIVQNHTLVSYFNGSTIYTGNIRILAKNIEFKHKLIDENIVFDMYNIIHSCMGKLPFVTDFSSIKVYFDYVDIDYELLFRNIDSIKRYIWNSIYNDFLVLNTYTKEDDAKIGGFGWIKAEQELGKVMDKWAEYSIFIDSLLVSLPKFIEIFIIESNKIFKHIERLQTKHPLFMNTSNKRTYSSMIYNYEKARKEVANDIRKM